jgi:hypothetical protein
MVFADVALRRALRIWFILNFQEDHPGLTDDEHRDDVLGKLLLLIDHTESEAHRARDAA